MGELNPTKSYYYESSSPFGRAQFGNASSDIPRKLAPVFGFEPNSFRLQWKAITRCAKQG